MNRSRIRSITVAGVFLAVLLTLIPVSSHAAGPISLTLDDQNLETDVAPVIKDGRTLVPIRIITENLDCEVNWDKDTKTVTITENGGSILMLTIGSTEGVKISSDGVESFFQMDVPASIANGRTMVPIRAITENLSSEPQIGWSNTLRKVCIYTPDFLSEKGIRDVNAYVASLKAVLDTSKITDLGSCGIYIDDDRNKYEGRILLVNGVYYIRGYDYLYNIQPSSDLSTKTELQAEDDWVGIKNSYEMLEKRASYDESSPLYNIYTINYGWTINEYHSEEYGKTVYTSDGSYVKYKPGNDNSFYDVFSDYMGYGTEEDILMEEEAFDVFFEINGGRNEWTADGEGYSKSSKTTPHVTGDFNYPNIMYKGEIFIPLNGGLYKDSTVSFKDSTAHVMSPEYVKAQADKANVKSATQTSRIAVGDTVYATAVFFKCWGTVYEVNGSKAKVHWVQVTGVYDTLVLDYAEIDFMSQASMTGKGIMMGASTWVNISDLYKK